MTKEFDCVAVLCAELTVIKTTTDVNTQCTCEMFTLYYLLLISRALTVLVLYIFCLEAITTSSHPFLNS